MLHGREREGPRWRCHACWPARSSGGSNRPAARSGSRSASRRPSRRASGRARSRRPCRTATPPLAEGQLATRADRRRPARRRRHRRHVGHAARAGRALLVRPEVRVRRRHDVGPAGREAARGRGPGGRIADVDGRGSAAPRPRVREGQAAVVPRPAGDVRADRAAHTGGRAAPRPRQLPAPGQRALRRARRASPRSSRTTPTAPAPAVPHRRPDLRRRHRHAVPAARRPRSAPSWRAPSRCPASRPTRGPAAPARRR